MINYLKTWKMQVVTVTAAVTAAVASLKKAMSCLNQQLAVATLGMGKAKACLKA